MNLERSIFPEHTLHREHIHWEDYIYKLTPVDVLDGVAFKRDDTFAPLGYGGINGGKVRQLIWLMQGAAAAGAEGVLYACSVRSDVSARLTLTARHFGLPVELIVGATKPHTMVRHENMAIAVAAGADTRIIKVAYNPQLQREADRLMKTPEYRGWMRVAYGVSMADSEPDTAFEAFYKLTGKQVDNLPDDRSTLILPAGSCNTAASVLYGLAQRRPARLSRIDLFEIGPSRRQWLDERLERLQRISGVDIGGYLDELEVVYHDLHGSGWARYADLRPATFGGLDLHPTYEGKIVTYCREIGLPLDDDVTMWVVGSQPTRMAMLNAFQLDGLPVDWAVQ